MAAHSLRGRCCTFRAAGFDAIIQQRILCVGDSKTGANSWPGSLTTNLNAAASPSPEFASDNIGVGATTAGFWATQLATELAKNARADKDNHAIALYNIGVNDFGFGSESQWIADVETVCDAIHTRWPACQVYLMRPWKRTFNATADTFAGRIDTVVAARSSFVHLGPDERVWLKSSDDGAANTTDGIHYSATGQTECAAAWKTALGF